MCRQIIKLPDIQIWSRGWNSIRFRDHLSEGNFDLNLRFLGIFFSLMSATATEKDWATELERDLMLELERFDEIFNAAEEEPPSGNPPSPRLSRGTLSTFELAAAESEKEELEDKLKILLSKTEDFDWQLRQLSEENIALRSANEHLHQENLQLKAIVAEYEQQAGRIRADHDNEPSAGSLDIEDLRLVEFKLAETRSKLARSQQLYEDLFMAKEQALRELEQERITRIHVEKERDAYSAAYEASLQHFERWKKTKSKSLT